MKTIISALFALALTACGGINVQQPKNNDQSDEGSGASHSKTPDENDPTAKAAEPSGDVTKDHGTSVQVDVQVQVRVSQDDGSSAMLDSARYNAADLTWNQAKDAAPAGYHLASRAELLALIDAGSLVKLGADKAELWSSTEESKDIAYFVDGDSGRVARMGKAMIMQAVYVRGDK